MVSITADSPRTVQDLFRQAINQLKVAEIGTFNFFAFAELTGKTFSSQAIRGTNSVRVVP